MDLLLYTHKLIRLAEESNVHIKKKYLQTKTIVLLLKIITIFNTKLEICVKILIG